MAKSALAAVPFGKMFRRPEGLPVFLYHGLAGSRAGQVPFRERKYWISEARFRSHLDQVRKAGYRIRLLEEMWGPGALPSSHPLASLTFDDGRVSDFEIAYPLLQAAGFRADFFVNTSTINHDGFLSWPQILEMQRSGMAFHSHSHAHVDLVRLSSAALECQLKDSKQILEDRLGCAVQFLSAPYGRLDRTVVEAAEQAGYRAVCSSRCWPATPGARTVNRVPVYARTTEREFRGLLRKNPLYYGRRAARAALVCLPILLWRCGPPPGQRGVHTLEEKA